MFPGTHAITQTHVSTHASKFKCAIYHTQNHIFSHFILLLLYISCNENVPKGGAYFAWKNILFELLDWIIKTPSKLDLHFESKYFAISVANQLKIVLWTICWWNVQTVHILISSYNGLFSFWKKIFCYGESILPTIYITQQKYFCLMVRLENRLLHRLSYA